MNHYLYSFNYVEEESGESVSTTVIFCDQSKLHQEEIRIDIETFYSSHFQTDKIFVICGIYAFPQIEEVFVKQQDITFKGIPKRQETSLNENLFLCHFLKDGTLHCPGKLVPEEFLKIYINEGLQNIFTKNGGLIASEGSHHFVFPSGKHCDRFLRTGNVLIYSPEIYFIAFALLPHFALRSFSKIYCDTSTINSVGFALKTLAQRLLFEAADIPVKSFKSYEGLYKGDTKYSKDDLLLISASTSANIINYILDHHGHLDRENIVILYFLGSTSGLSNLKDQLLCNLGKSDLNPNGIEPYDTHKEENCIFCKAGSYPVSVGGDVFLLENPKINKILFKVTDADKNLSPFINQFRSVATTGTVLKVNYKENDEKSFKYSTYIDFYVILEGIKNGRYGKFKEKLHDHIDQFIPSNSKFILSLNDNASVQLADYIENQIQNNYKAKSKPKVLNQDQLHTIPSDTQGTVVVIASCISNGKNLLYISRALRRCDKLRIVYFVGISRTKNQVYLDALKDNLKRGKYGAETNSFIEVEKMFSANDYRSTSWMDEIEFLKGFTTFLRDIEADDKVVTFYEARQTMIEHHSGDSVRGLSMKLFYPSTLDHELELRKNFAFFNFNGYHGNITQSDTYFALSSIINSLRNSDKTDRTLKQSGFVRNIIDPDNFNRFNDGIIQAAILRAATPHELAYNFDFDISRQMTRTLETLIKYHNDEQGEALVEFIYAIAIKKLSLKTTDLKYVLLQIKESCGQYPLINYLQKYIEEVIFKKLFES